MGIRQEHGKVLKLQVVQALYGMIPYHERAEHEASFESAYRHILGESWDQSGLSMESAEGLGYYLRGVASASGTPVRHNHSKVMRGLARSVLSLESRMSAWDNGTLAGAIATNSLEAEANALFKRHGLSGLSLEADDKPSAWKNLGKMIAGLFKGKEKVKKSDEEPFDPKKVDWSSVHKMASYIEDTSFPFLKSDATTEQPDKVSGEGIVKNLTWGTEFDEKNPVAFIKKKFSEWEKWYHIHEQAVEAHSKVVEQDEKTTRPAVMKAGDDEEAKEAILDKAIETMKAAPNPVKAAAKLKVDFPGGRVLVTRPVSVNNPFGLIECVAAKSGKEIKELRPLTKEEAHQLLTWLRDTVMKLKNYTTIYDKGRWSDHSDGDEFWDRIEMTTGEALYGAMVYWQSNHMDFLDWVDDISVILAELSNGIMNWVDRSFKQ